MTIKASYILTIAVFLLTGGVITALALFPSRFFPSLEAREIKQTRIIERGGADAASETLTSDENIAYKDSALSKVALNDDEIIVVVLDDNFDNDIQEEQIIAYRSRLWESNPIYITYVDFDESSQTYKRVWNVETTIIRPGTIDFYIQDLTGDHIPSVLLSGMNMENEFVLIAFKKNDGLEPFRKIADFRIEGSTIVKEVERSQAYQLGMANSHSFPIIAYGRDAESTNILDRVEISYVYNSDIGEYRQDSLTRIPGKQLEEQKFRDILNGGTRSFEQFINGLWYWILPDGSIDSRQYIYFDPQNKEVIFYTDETQQVFIWQNSSATRYGLYLATQNISVQTLRRSLDIALESLDSVRIRVSEDVRLKIGIDASWNGSYKRANFIAPPTQTSVKSVSSFIEGTYNGVIGRIRFSKNGAYALTLGESAQTGIYSFFCIGDTELMELRPEGKPHTTYVVEHVDRTLSLRRVTISANGIQDLHEPTFSMELELNSSIDSPLDS
ncbi:MAG: pallilysin-related adhesin [Treponema sp.]|jgi:hypothetical protein|nr:pallilysin-related adhesin [Treponema sp.]